MKVPPDAQNETAMLQNPDGFQGSADTVRCTAHHAGEHQAGLMKHDEAESAFMESHPAATHAPV